MLPACLINESYVFLVSMHLWALMPSMLTDCPNIQTLAIKLEMDHKMKISDTYQYFYDTYGKEMRILYILYKKHLISFFQLKFVLKNTCIASRSSQYCY